MNFTLISITFFWFIVEFKKLLFWIYLWQLKEYQWGRVRAYLKTRQGLRVILLSPQRWIKLLFLVGVLYLSIPEILFVPLGFVLAFEALVFSFRWTRGKAVRPVFTKRALATLGLGLFLICFWAGIHFYFKPTFVFVSALLLFDITAFFLFSLVVLFFQPLALIWCRKLLEKAKKRRERVKHLKAIGVTGSYGKSSVKEFLACILSERFKVLKTKKNQNSEVGVARCIIDELKREHEVFVAEIGAYNKGKVKQIAGIVQPQVGVLTGINEQHLATFGSLNNIIEGKFELIDSLSSGDTAIVNWDNEYIRSKVYNSHFMDKKVVKCSVSGKADLWGEETEIEKEKLSFKVVSKTGERAEVSLSLAGRQNIINFLMAAAAAMELGVGLEEISRAGEKIAAPKSGMTVKKGKGGVSVVDDTYSANPCGVVAAIEHLKLWQGKKIVVMPCLIELGKESKNIHREIGEMIGRVCDLAVITSLDFLDQIVKGAQTSGMNSARILFLNKTELILKKLKPFFKEENVILLESRVPKNLPKALTWDL